MEGLIRTLGAEPADLTSAQKAARRAFAGPSELAALGRAFAWSSTPLGPADRWPEALTATVRLMLGSPTPTSLWVGREFTVLYNDAFARLIGSQHPRAFGSAGTGTWAAESWPDFRRHLEQVWAGGQPIHVDAARLPVTRRGDDADAWFAYSLSALTDADGQCIAIYNVAVEVTEQVLARHEVESLLGESQRARAEAEAARRAAEAANRAKSEFLATMSHELRTPLNAMVGYSQLLGMGVLGPATPAQHAHLERLQASARHLLRLVEDVLDVAKIDADRLDVRRDTYVTGAAVSAAVALVQPQATAKGVRLVDLGTGTPGVPFVGDEHRVRQVLVNLLSNAVKFTPPGGQVTVACGAADEPEPGVVRPDVRLSATQGSAAPWAFVQVEDTGPGIEPDQIEHLFEAFVQGDNALTREQGGTGLGLAISRRLARLMGGDVSARNGAGSGAVFTLWLPGSPPAEASPPSLASVDARRTPPRSTASVVNPADGPLDEQSFAIVHALGTRLAADAEIIAERYERMLRADPRFPGAHELPNCQLRDHATPVVGLLASQLMIIGETHGRAPELLADGGEVQRVMAELHGVQRYRLGWSESDIEREVPLLLAEVERVLQGALETGQAAASLRSDHAEAEQVAEQPGRVAAHYAADVSRYVFEQCARTAMRSYRFARAADTP